MSYTSIHLVPEKLLLDPNNPRFSKSHDEETREEMFVDPEIQEYTLERMVEHEDVHEVEASIRKAGYLDSDPIFVRKVLDTDYYVVLEGNRRMSAVKSLLAKHHAGKTRHDVLETSILDTLASIPCKDLTGLKDADVDYLLGLRHGGAIKQWPPLPASFNLYKMYMREFCALRNIPNTRTNFRFDRSILKDIAASFSITTANATKRLKTYCVYADLASAYPSLKGELEKKYSIIEEIIAKKSVCTEFDFDEAEMFKFSPAGTERFIDVVFGSDETKPIVGGASVGTREGCSVREYADLLSKATGGLRSEFIENRLYENRESVVDLLSELTQREKERTLLSALVVAAAELKKITQGDLIRTTEFSDADREQLEVIKQIIADIDAKVSQKKR